MNKALLDQVTANCRTPEDVEALYVKLLQHVQDRTRVQFPDPRVADDPVEPRAVRKRRRRVKPSDSEALRFDDAAVAAINAWKARPLAAIYPIVWLDSISVNVQQDQRVISTTASVLLGVNLRGDKDILGLWFSERGGTGFWLAVLNELRERGVNDIYIACMEEEEGLAAALEAVFPDTMRQHCVVHLVRASLRYVNTKDSRAVLAALKQVYQASNVENAAAGLAALEADWGDRYRSVVRLWRGHWERIVPLFRFRPEIRKVLYTTSAIESLNTVMRTALSHRRIFQDETRAAAALALAIREASSNWTSIHHWKPALQGIQILFGETRMPLDAL